jgi:S1-C subfamily serine protease
VEPGTPAAEAHLAEGDLLLEANGNPVDTLDDLQRVLVLSAPPEIELAVLRGSARRRLSIRPRAARAVA